MRKVAALTVFFLLLVGDSTAQQLRLSGSQLTLPQGNVIGASWSDNLLFVQQLATRLDGPTVRTSRRVLSWNLLANSIVKEKTLAADSRFKGDDCGRVEANPKSKVVVICEDSTTLSVLDSDTLSVISEIHCDGYIYDFALDDVLKRVFVAWRSASDAEYLTAFEVAGGKQLDQTEIPSHGADKSERGELGKIQVVADSHSRRLAIARSVLGHGGYTSDLYACTYTGAIICGQIAREKQVGQIAIWGSEVILADGSLADDRHVCLTGVNLNSGAISRRYCASRTGVHYGVGIISGKYVVGYTGVEKYRPLKERTTTSGSSVSVWRYENSIAVADALQNGMSASPLSGVRIACSREAPRFLLYSETSGTAYVYSIDE